MKTLKNITRFALITITTAISILFFMILLCRTDLIIDLMVSKPVLFLLGLTLGATIGIIASVIATAFHFMKEIAAKDKIIETKSNEAKKLQSDLDEAEAIVKRLIRPLHEERARKNSSRGKAIIAQIADLSDEETTNIDAEDDSASMEGSSDDEA